MNSLRHSRIGKRGCLTILFFCFVISCLITPFAFSQNKRFLTDLYGSYLRGLSYANQGDFTEALKELRKVKAKDPQSIHVRLKIATIMVRLGKIKEAEEELKKAKKIDPDNLDIPLALIFVYSYAEKNEELESEYEQFLRKAHELKPANIGISEYLAQFYFYKKKPKEAILIYEKILEGNPDYAEAYFWLGYLYDEIGERDKSLDTWKQGLKKDPNFAPILNSLGYSYAQEGVNLDKAEDMIKRALEKEPENGAYLDSLGWVYFKQGDFKKAEDCLTKAVTYIKDPEVYEHLGDLYIKLGDIKKGVSYYEEGLTHFADDKDLQMKVKRYGKKDQELKN